MNLFRNLSLSKAHQRISKAKIVGVLHFAFAFPLSNGNGSSMTSTEHAKTAQTQNPIPSNPASAQQTASRRRRDPAAFRMTACRHVFLFA
jgi:hypothetical protein